VRDDFTEAQIGVVVREYVRGSWIPLPADLHAHIGVREQVLHIVGSDAARRDEPERIVDVTVADRCEPTLAGPSPRRLEEREGEGCDPDAEQDPHDPFDDMVVDPTDGLSDTW